MAKVLCNDCYRMKNIDIIVHKNRGRHVKEFSVSYFILPIYLLPNVIPRTYGPSRSSHLLYGRQGGP